MRSSHLVANFAHQRVKSDVPGAPLQVRVEHMPEDGTPVPGRLRAVAAAPLADPHAGAHGPDGRPVRIDGGAGPGDARGLPPA